MVKCTLEMYMYMYKYAYMYMYDHVYTCTLELYVHVVALRRKMTTLLNTVTRLMHTSMHTCPNRYVCPVYEHKTPLLAVR